MKLALYVLFSPFVLFGWVAATAFVFAHAGFNIALDFLEDLL